MASYPRTSLKRSGNITSLSHKNLEMLETGYGASGGYWSHDVSHGGRTARITINPNSNNGQLGEVSIKGVFNGRMMGNSAGGSAYC